MIEVHGTPIHSLPARQLRSACDPGQFKFGDTASLPEPSEPFGQARAMQALQLALDTAGRGYNVFLLGRPGSGRHAAVRRRLEAHAATRPPPPDCCYIYNFADPQKPRVLTLPTGEGARLRTAMQGFVTELGKAIEAAFEGDEYRSRLEAIQKDTKQREETALQALGDEALQQGVALVHTPQGFSFAPVKKNREPMTEREFDALPPAQKEHIRESIQRLSERLLAWMQQLPRIRRDMQARIREASRDTMSLAAGHLIAELKESFAAHAEVLSFLEEVLRDVVEAGDRLRTQTDSEEEVSEVSGTLSLTRYQVNLLVGHDASAHAPVIACDNPTYPNLVGRVDHVAHLGTLLTNFTMVKPGALHRANGGYLVLDALQVLSHAGAWDGLKRALKSGRVNIESLPEALGLTGSAPVLDPEPVDLSLKVVLVGERQHYYLLQALDADFDELFRIAADFEDDVPRTAESVADFAGFTAALARAQQLRACDPEAVARLVEEAARTAGDAERLSTHSRGLEELLQEANTHAGRAGRPVIGRQDVAQALLAREHRSDRVRDHLRQAVLRDSLMIATSGTQAGQVNGLAVIELGGFSFGQPLRVTATARLGEDKVVDIERESALGQPLHSKGVLILSSFLEARYAGSTPPSFAASLVFEQSYGPVEGDSASLAELCALLSALARVPVRQGVAVTGSINQLGAVQPVGGVNEKIEGFFDLCRARGLTGDQGVLVPSANVRNLMLREDVVEAVDEGRFHVYAVSDVDEALALLTGLPAGTADAAGQWPHASFNGLVAQRLDQFSQARQTYGVGQRPRLRRPRHRPQPLVHGAHAEPPPGTKGLP